MKINRGFDVEAVQRAVARIEHAQGRLPELRARYEVCNTGQVVRKPREHAEVRQPSQRKCEREADTGEQPAERIAIKEAGPIIARATSWEQLHAALADQGMRYERAGSGAKVFVEQIPVKASRVAREASFGRLQKRLGAYRPPGQAPRPARTEHGPPLPVVAGRQEYREHRAAHYAQKKKAWEHLRETQRAERRQMLQRARQR